MNIEQSQNVEYYKLGLKNIINILLVIGFACLFSVSSRIGIYIFYLLPILIPAILIMVWCDICNIRVNRSRDYAFRTTSIIWFSLSTLILLPCYLGVFFGIFYPLQSIQYEQIDNCRVTGVIPLISKHYERYQILYVDFQYDSQPFLGYACMSNLAEEDYQYYYIYKGQHVPCDQAGPSYDLSKRRTLFNRQRVLNGENRQLRTREKCFKYGKTNSTLFNFSNVKLPSWLCLDSKISFQELTNLTTCFVSRFGNRQLSYQNAQNRISPRYIDDFFLTVFSMPTYFPKNSYICLIVFCFLPYLLNFYPLAGIITESIYKLRKKSYQILDNNNT